MNYQEIKQKLHGNISVPSEIFCRKIFPEVSRTFAINVVKLPNPLQFEVLISYLLCRIADTIEDSENLSPDEKSNFLGDFIQTLESEQSCSNDKPFILSYKKMDEEKTDVFLLKHSNKVLECFQKFPTERREHICKWVVELSSGMQQYALRKTGSNEQVTFLESLDDLEEYCYYVAGTVGHLLSKLFYFHYPSITEPMYDKLSEKASSFGIGLQLTNIIKDSVVDYQRGWCYLPQNLLNEYGVAGDKFLSEEYRGQSMELLSQIILRACHHLDNALDYTCLIPKRAIKVRIFCFLPLFMAIKTLAEAWQNPQLFNPEDPVKITRRDVKEIVQKTYLYGISNRQMQSWYKTIRRDIPTT